MHACITGGKYSTVLAHIMTLLNKRHNYGLKLVLLSIDEGIAGMCTYCPTHSIYGLCNIIATFIYYKVIVDNCDFHGEFSLA